MRGVARIGNRLDAYRVSVITEEQLAARLRWIGVQLEPVVGGRMMKSVWPAVAGDANVALWEEDEE